MSDRTTIFFVHGIKTRERDFDRLTNQIRTGLKRNDHIDFFPVFWGNFCRDRESAFEGKSYPFEGRMQRSERRFNLRSESKPTPTALECDVATQAGTRLESEHRVQEHADIVASEAIKSLTENFDLKADSFALDYATRYIRNRSAGGEPLQVAESLLPLASELNNLGYETSPIPTEISPSALISPGQDRGSLSTKIPGIMTQAFFERILPLCAEFVSDILIYFGDSGEQIDNHIIGKVRDLIGKNDHRIVLIGHSLGAVILFRCIDRLLMELPLLGARGDTKFLSIGTQIGLLSELGFLSKTPRFVNEIFWENIYSPMDYLSSRAEPFYPTCRDKVWNCASSFPASHGEYFVSDSFYQWLNEQL